MTTHLRDEFFEGLHDLVTGRFLVVGEETSYDDDGNQYQSQVEL